MKRVNGYYWVMFKGGESWEIVQWNGVVWNSFDTEEWFRDRDFTEINETRILSPDEKTKS